MMTNATPPRDLNRSMLRRVPFWAVVTVFFGAVAAATWIDRPIYDALHDYFTFNTRPVPEHLRLARRVLRTFQDWGEQVSIVAVGVVMWQLDRRRRSQVLCLLVAALMVTGTVELMKRVYGRERPDVSAGAGGF
ncbi:MAG: hypothetical protein ACRDD1_17540, partial [Planctomycetia bacterium]